VSCDVEDWEVEDWQVQTFLTSRRRGRVRKENPIHKEYITNRPNSGEKEQS